MVQHSIFGLIFFQIGFVKVLHFSHSSMVFTFPYSACQFLYSSFNLWSILSIFFLIMENSFSVKAICHSSAEIVDAWLMELLTTFLVFSMFWAIWEYTTSLSSLSGCLDCLPLLCFITFNAFLWDSHSCLLLSFHSVQNVLILLVNSVDARDPSSIKGMFKGSHTLLISCIWLSDMQSLLSHLT